MKTLKEFINEGLRDHLKKFKAKVQKFINTSVQISGNIITTEYHPEWGSELYNDKNNKMTETWIKKVNEVVSKTVKMSIPNAESLGPYGISYVFETDETDETILKNYWDSISKELIKYFKNEDVTIYNDDISNLEGARLTFESNINTNMAATVEIYF